MTAARNIEGTANVAIAGVEAIGAFSNLTEPHVTSNIAGGVIKTMGSVAEAVGPFLPFVAVVSALVKEIVDVYETVQYNKRTCGILVNRVEAAEVAIKALMRQTEDNL